VASGAIARVTAQAPVVVSALSARAGHVALLKSSDEAPSELYALEMGRLRKLTSHNDQWLSHVQLGAVEDVQFKSKDGTDIHGLIVKPPTYAPGQKYPLVLWIHGGPNTQDEHAFNLDGYRFAHQMFAAEGFAVLGVNYRGSAGRGAAYARAIFADWGHTEVEDLLSGAEYAVARGIAEPSKLFVGGWSYGGMLTDYTIASDGRFKAAISGAGCGNPIVMYGSDQFIYEYNQELGPPWENTAAWLRLAYPFFHADRIHTPTLFIGGARDFDVPIAGSEQMYQALRTLGVPTELVIYPDQYHVITRPSLIVDLIQRMTGWWARYLPSPR
jgi:dipeptidyl aminopeptidase/acylaminoacyl peptidase